MKTKTLIASAGLAAVAFAQVASETPTKDAYIFSYFCGQSDGLHLAVSDDGLNWTALNGNKSVLKPTVGKDRLMRDPSICRGPDGVYRMVWTTSWHDRIIGYAETRDFVKWSEQRAIPVMEHEKGCRNCWAPELTYDPDTGTYHIYWASTIAGRGDGHRIYRTTTRDFKTFTPTKKWFDPGFSVIDAAIVRDPITHDWVMTIKDEREKPVAKKHILTTRTKSLDKGFPTKLDGPINFGPDWVEGPSPFLVGKEMFVCFDNYRRGRYNMISSSDGGKSWKDRTAELHLPKGIRHGTVIVVPKHEKDALAAMSAVGGVKDEVHGYTPKGYVQPKEPEVRERLEWFKDQKLALMMCLGLYSNIGIKESWPLCDSKASWSRVEVDWTADIDEFKRQYFDLIRSFNPVRFRPETWAKAAKDNGFKYVLFTTKQHDGFCLYDTKYSSYKVTSPQCPFSMDKRADIVKHVFDAFRAEGLGIAAYFSKPDWYHTDFWENHGIGRKTTPFPTYDVKKHPEKWARFREFTRNQIVEIVRDYGKVDIIWLDGGQVQRRRGLDIGIEDIIAEARKYNPALIAVDRTAGGTCENVITPEQTVPKTPIAVPWESCITIGKYWGYHFEDEYKPVRQILHLLIDIVAKGGNLALGVGPQPDGRLPHQALERMTALGAWLKVNGEAIYETRPLAPYRKGDWAFTRNRRTGVEYAIRLWKEGEAGTGRQSIPGVTAAKLVHVGSGRAVAPRPLSPATGKSFNGAKAAIGVEFELPADFKADANADVFRIVH